MTLQEACGRYAISIEELMAWEAAFQLLGPKGLYATRRSNGGQTVEFFTRDKLEVGQSAANGK